MGVEEVNAGAEAAARGGVEVPTVNWGRGPGVVGVRLGRGDCGGRHDPKGVEMCVVAGLRDKGCAGDGWEGGSGGAGDAGGNEGGGRARLTAGKGG